MQLDLRTLSDVAGRHVAVDVAVERLRQIAQAAFSEALSALNVETLRHDPARFHAVSRSVEQMVQVLRGPNDRLG